MVTLHGSWRVAPLGGYFFLWGEAWRDELPTLDSAARPLPHPFCLSSVELQAWLEQELSLAVATDQAQTETLSLPSRVQKKQLLPLLANQIGEGLKPQGLSIIPWQISGLALTASETLALLQTISLGDSEARFWGQELFFFAHLYRWSLDLVARGKMVPGIQTKELEPQAAWFPLLDSILDQARLARLCQALPACCLAYTRPDVDAVGPHALILDCLQSLLQALIAGVGLTPSPLRGTALQPWLQGLVSPTALPLPKTTAQKLLTPLQHWQLPLQAFLGHRHNPALEQHQFRVALRLTPPLAGQESWRLDYLLQALDQETFQVEAAIIWQREAEAVVYQGRRLHHPAETLLRGLGLASRYYSPIAQSLETRYPTACILEPIQAYEFIQAVAWQLQDRGLGVILPAGLQGQASQRLGVSIQSSIQPRQGQRLTFKSLVSYQLQLMLGDQVISEQDFQNLLAQRSPLVEIGGRWLLLQPTEVRAAQAILQKCQAPLDLTVEEALRLAVGERQTLAKLPVVKFEATGILQDLIQTLSHPQGVDPIATPPGFKGELRPYQARGVGWLAFLERWGLGACLADDMGLGKTPQLLAFLLHLQAEAGLERPVLVVCPTSVLSNWGHEVQKFAPGLQTTIHHGDRRKKGQPLLKAYRSQQLILTSYSLLHRDLSSLKLVQWQGIVLDEAQNIKNAEAKQSQAVRQLTAGFRIALTGTPVENRLRELWSILDFLNPGFLGSQAYFQKRFATPIEKYGDRQSLYALRSLVRPFILRRLKTDQSIIQDLPAKQEMTIFCGLSRRQAELYQQLVDQSLAAIETSTGIQRHGQILTLILKLKQLCNHPAQFLKQSQLSEPEVSGKLLRLEEMLEEVVSEGDRALIFTQFAEWGHLLQPYLRQKFKRDVLYLHGGTPRLKRQALIDRFQNDPDGPQLFILSLKAGGTGLNLTRANHVFHIDRWWNPAVENQATDRAFRIGQTRNVQVHKFVCTGTLEEKIHQILDSKQHLAEQTVDAGENWLTQLDTEQLRHLLLLDRGSIIDEDS